MHNRVVLDLSGERVFTELTPEAAKKRLAELQGEGRDAFIPSPDVEDAEVARAAARRANQLLAESQERLVAAERGFSAEADAHRETYARLKRAQEQLAKADARIAELDAIVAELIVATPPDVGPMVDRFLGWPLPKTFAPDAGISFKAPEAPNSWPVGTNLFTAAEARAMFEHALVPAPKPAGVPDESPNDPAATEISGTPA